MRIDASISVLSCEGTKTRSKLPPLFLQYLRWKAFVTGKFPRGSWSESAAEYKRTDEGIDPASPPSTQKTIASFLDRKTAAIDALVEKKQKLLGLLKEKRAALINQAVTKGLDPNVPMKDSGIAWIGEIPAHWEVKRCKFLCSRIKTGTTPATSEPEWYEDGEIPWYAPGSFDSMSIKLKAPKALLSPRVWMAKVVPQFPKGTVLVVGIGATLGKIAHLDTIATANQQVLALEFCASFMNSKFAAYQFKYREAVFRDQALYTTLPIMNQEGIGNHLVVCPSRAEQQLIVEFIQTHELIGDQLLELVSTQIAKLQEYRQALITAAVTGQLDVSAVESEPLELTL